MITQTSKHIYHTKQQLLIIKNNCMILLESFWYRPIIDYSKIKSAMKMNYKLNNRRGLKDKKGSSDSGSNSSVDGDVNKNSSSGSGDDGGRSSSSYFNGGSSKNNNSSGDSVIDSHNNDRNITFDESNGNSFSDLDLHTNNDDNS